MRKGKSVADAVGTELVEVTPDRPGLLVLDRRRSMISSEEPQFHLDQPWGQLYAAALKGRDWALFDRATEEAWKHAWSFVALAGGQYHHSCIARTALAQLQLLETARVHWPTLVAVGGRYTQGMDWGESLEEVHTLVGFCLARQGAARDPSSPLTFTRLVEMIDTLPGHRIRALLASGDVDSAIALLDDRQEVVLLSLAEHFLAFGLDDVACRAVEARCKSDPYGHVRKWLDGRGNLSRTVR
jgi:hypothetical protein